MENLQPLQCIRAISTESSNKFCCGRLLGWHESTAYFCEGFRCCNKLLTDHLTRCGSVVRWVLISNTSPDGFVNERLLLEINKLCPNIQRLQMISKNVSLQRVACLAELTQTLRQLKELFLQNVQTCKQGLVCALAHCSSLETLYIRTVDQEIGLEIALPTLKSITIESRYMSSSVLIAIAQRCVKLETLKVFKSLQRAGCRIEDAGVRAVLQGCPLLRETDVESAEGINDQLRVELARRHNFTQLDLTLWRDTTEELLQEVLKVSPNLTSLNAGLFVGRFTDDTLAVCAQHCPQLKILHLSGLHRITDDGVRHLVSIVGRGLRDVGLFCCAQLGDESVLAIAKHCPLLEKFFPRPKMSDAAMARLAECCVHLELPPSPPEGDLHAVRRYSAVGLREVRDSAAHAVCCCGWLLCSVLSRCLRLGSRKSAVVAQT
jgi:hypothetical protein